MFLEQHLRSMQLQNFVISSIVYIISLFLYCCLLHIDYCISAIHHVVGQDPEAAVPSRLVGVLQGQARDGAACHSMISMEETAGSLIEIMQCLVGGGGTRLSIFLQFLAGDPVFCFLKMACFTGESKNNSKW